MRIGIDGRELLGLRTGVGRYVANLCAQWMSSPSATDHELVLYTPAPLATLPGATGGTTTGGARLTSTVVAGDGDGWWEQTALAQQAAGDGLDVFFGPGYSVPLRLDVPSVVTLHDVSFLAHPEWFGWREGFRRRWLARRAAVTARTVVTVSSFSRQEILRHCDLDPARVRVIHNGVAAPAVRAASATPPDGTRVPPADRRPLILYVGALFTRRRLPTLLAAFGLVARRIPSAELVIVGPDRTYPRQDLRGIADAAGIASRVTFRAYVSDDELAALYRRATVFAYLSEYEGFGLTPLEALAAGVPVVAGDTPVAREIYADAARYVPVDDHAAVAAALVEMITRPEARSAVLAGRASLLVRFTWARAAADTLAVLEEAAATPR